MKAVIDPMILTLETGHRKNPKQIWALGVGAVVMLPLEELKHILLHWKFQEDITCNYEVMSTQTWWKLKYKSTKFWLLCTSTACNSENVHSMTLVQLCLFFFRYTKQKAISWFCQGQVGSCSTFKTAFLWLADPHKQEVEIAGGWDCAHIGPQQFMSHTAAKKC